MAKLGSHPKKPQPRNGNNADRTPKPRAGRIQFEGCWHCGAKGHSRKECKAFQKLMAEANKGISDRSKWKLPAGYKGKYEEAKAKAKAAAAKRVNALGGEDAEDDNTEGEWEDSEAEESFRAGIRALVGTDCRCGCDGDDDLVCGRCEEFEGDDGEYGDDEEQMLNTLNQWAHRTVFKLKNRQGKEVRKFVVSTEQQLDQMLGSRSRIAKIAKGKKNNLKTPVVHLKTTKF